MKLVGFAGKAGSGKTTAALLLQNYGFGRVSISTGIKQEVYFFLSKTDCAFYMDHLYGSQESKEKVLTLHTSTVHSIISNIMEMPLDWPRDSQVEFTCRELLQWWGAMRRRKDKHYWIRKAMVHIDATLSTRQYCGVVVDDVRLWEEHEMLTERGFEIFRIVRVNQPVNMFGNDVTETELDGIQLKTIFNNGENAIHFHKEVLDATIHK